MAYNQLGDDSTRNIILLGKSGIGKSSLGNVLLGEKKFKTSMMEDKGTKQCQMEVKNGLTLIDTPGFYSSLRSDVASAKNIIDTLLQNWFDIHVFLLVFSVDDRFAGNEQEMLDLVIKLFGKEVMNHMIVVFTGKDSLDDEEDNEFRIPKCLPGNIRHFIVSCKKTPQVDIDDIFREIYSIRFTKPVAIKQLDRNVLNEIQRLEDKRRSENTPDPEAYKRAVYSGMGLDPNSGPSSNTDNRNIPARSSSPTQQYTDSSRPNICEEIRSFFSRCFNGSK